MLLGCSRLRATQTATGRPTGDVSVCACVCVCLCSICLRRRLRGSHRRRWRRCWRCSVAGSALATQQHFAPNKRTRTLCVCACPKVCALAYSRVARPVCLYWLRAGATLAHTHAPVSGAGALGRTHTRTGRQLYRLARQLCGGRALQGRRVGARAHWLALRSALRPAAFRPERTRRRPSIEVDSRARPAAQPWAPRKPLIGFRLFPECARLCAVRTPAPTAQVGAPAPIAPVAAASLRGRSRAGATGRRALALVSPALAASCALAGELASEQPLVGKLESRQPVCTDARPPLPATGWRQCRLVRTRALQHQSARPGKPIKVSTGSNLRAPSCLPAVGFVIVDGGQLAESCATLASPPTFVLASRPRRPASVRLNVEQASPRI